VARARMRSPALSAGLNPSTIEISCVDPYYLMGRDLVNYGQVRAAVRVMEEVVRIREQTLAEDHSDRLVSQHALTGAYQANGQVNDARYGCCKRW
jgi:hypothetical protein